MVRRLEDSSAIETSLGWDGRLQAGCGRWFSRLFLRKSERREVLAGRGGGGGGTMRRGRGLRWTASSASMSLDLRVVSAVATPRCAPIFSNPASNLSRATTLEVPT